MTSSHMEESLRRQWQLRNSFSLLGMGGENCKPFVPDDLFKVDQVLLRVDAVQPSLRAKYTGTLQGLQRGDKVFTLQLPHKTDTVSIDRLVPFYT